MNTIRCISAELKKVMISPYFLVGVLAFTLMCFTSPCYMDIETTKEVSIFEMLSLMTTEVADSVEFSAEYVCSKGFGYWITQFLCIIVSFPFIKVLCDERRFSEKRYIICRTGAFRYCLSKFVGAVVSAAVLCAAGFLLFTAVVYMIFPSGNKLTPVQEEWLARLDIPYLRCLFETVITGVGVAIPPFVVCIFTRNQYFCICIPFLLQYMQMTFANKLFMTYAESYTEQQRVVLMALYPQNLRMAAYGADEGILSAALYLLLALTALIVFYISQRRCVDSGQ